MFPSGSAPAISGAAATGVTGVELTHADEGRALAAAELVEDVEATHQLEAGRVQVAVDHPAGPLLVARRARALGRRRRTRAVSR